MGEVKGDRGCGKVYRDLRADILRLNLKPGSVIDEATVGERFSVSRTPVHEAVILLISEGLVVRDGCVAIVAPLNFDALPKTYDALVMSSRIVQRLSFSRLKNAIFETSMHEVESLSLNLETRDPEMFPT